MENQTTITMSAGILLLSFLHTVVCSKQCTDSTVLKNAVSNGTAVKIKNLDNYEQTYESATNTWFFGSRTAGTKGNSIGIFVTDSGADQIAVIPAPGSGNEPNFVADEALSATSGAAGKVFRYSIVLTVDTVVGDFTLVILYYSWYWWF